MRHEFVFQVNAINEQKRIKMIQFFTRLVVIDKNAGKEMRLIYYNNNNCYYYCTHILLYKRVM